ncbi:phospholipase A2, membrane associated precursor [Cavia porcellus]|uniref:Phospholipase A2, membrane associated n=1 Tax=Cavia porcellus TaxID=10141 RepID=PA2GA_CAVPO|nr:phospholipase A2, membrane associated precursor [Cavia porcellus]P47711.1 RecName: Full=Phospholipase A2, membrane associated; AltName: Full=GIIC sPLA2; AltName: Full=Group IIA phospholipase A2; AltName: Full=Phosphatidylcholine 2-acylhydrolase 2A; Flags: Precursor [Cavia porcellus]CAA57953.1 typeII phospholipase A2 [Cavia porcellus]
MKLLLLLLVVMASDLPQAHGHLKQFTEMIKLTTGKNGLTSYGAYGCHCGVGGKGTPKDATDRCCVRHDCCYDRLMKRGCGTKFLNYRFTHKGSSITCSVKQNSCQKQLCECDKAAAYCFAANLKSYSRRYQFYYNGLCRGKTPSC